MMEKVKLDLPVILPEIEDERDQCITMLTSRLAGVRGVEVAHVTRSDDTLNSVSISTQT